jgi:hypothetical protein
MPEEIMPRTGSAACSLNNTGISAATKLHVIHRDDTENRFDRREMIIGNFRSAEEITDRSVDFPTFGKPIRPTSAISFSSIFRLNSSPGIPARAKFRCLTDRIGKMNISLSAATALGDDHFLTGFGKVTRSVARFIVIDHRTDGTAMRRSTAPARTFCARGLSRRPPRQICA